MPHRDSNGNWTLTEEERRQHAIIGRDRSRYKRHALSPPATAEEIAAEIARIERDRPQNEVDVTTEGT